MTIGLSNTTLGLFVECPKCFWLAKVKKLERPSNPFPSVTKGIDQIMKAYVEEALIDGAPLDWLIGMEVVPYPDRAKIKVFQSWRTFQRSLTVANLELKVWGELDDLLMDAEGKVAAWDFKSKGAEPDAGYSERYYQLQADLYKLLLEGQEGYECANHTYFTYAWPVLKIGAIELATKTFKIAADSHRGLDTLYAAAKCLEGPMPRSKPGCGMCKYLSERMAFA